MRINPQTPDLEELLDQYAAARTARDRTQLQFDEAQKRLIDAMQAEQQKQVHRMDASGQLYRASFVQKTTTTIDEKSLRKALTARVFDKYTKKVLDKRAMERAMDLGEVDPVVVSKHVTVTPAKPYLTYNQIAPQEETDGSS